MIKIGKTQSIRRRKNNRERNKKKKRQEELKEKIKGK